MLKDVAQLKKRILPILRESDVTRSAVFGSLARGEAKKNSDIDLLVEFGSPKSLFDLVELQLKLEELLEAKVDLLTYRSVSPLLKDAIFKEARQIL